MIIVHAHQNSNRLNYVLNFCFGSRGIEYTIHSSDDIGKIVIENTEGSSLDLSSSSLLFDKGIINYSLDKVVKDGVEFLNFNGEDDLLGSIFYVLSRFEEWLPYPTDEHGRFKLTNSIQFHFGWLEKAICDRWTKWMYDQLGLDYKVNFQVIPTFDIDNTFAYKFKKGIRRSLSKAKDFLKGDKQRIKERREVDKGARDPYDTFELISSIIKQNRFAKVFWLVAPLGKNDRNLSIDNEDHQALIRLINVDGQVGLHPGYRTMEDNSALLLQKQGLENVLGRPVKSSRQHFLKFRISATYSSLLQVGIKHEYSMGFAEQPGFRAGTAHPHPWYNLSDEVITDLIIHPFVYMDGTLNEYMGLSTDKAIQKIHELWDEVKEFGGDFIFIWHNETIGDYGRWKDWSRVLKATLKLS